MEGYDKNRLIVIIPFVCKVLEQSATSKVFRPPNPWLVAILRLLVELYHFAELKMNLKFEIEVLCKNINLDIKEIEPSKFLKDRPVRSIAQSTQRMTLNDQPAASGTGNMIIIIHLF